jgi:hypothetical protein
MPSEDIGTAAKILPGFSQRRFARRWRGAIGPLGWYRACAESSRNDVFQMTLESIAASYRKSFRDSHSKFRGSKLQLQPELALARRG